MDSSAASMDDYISGGIDTRRVRRRFQAQSDENVTVDDRDLDETSVVYGTHPSDEATTTGTRPIPRIDLSPLERQFHFTAPGSVAHNINEVPIRECMCLNTHR